MDKIYKEKLTDLEYKVCRQKATEPPFSGIYNDFKNKGIFTCKCCDAKLFTSDAKYDSKSGWPSFYDSIDDDCIEFSEDFTHGMSRIEIACKKCKSHLGHIFDDGIAPTFKRYCVNSVSLNFEKS